MKKYLMTGVAAIAFVAVFTSCSKSNDLYDEGAVKERQQQQEQQKVENNIELAKAQYAAAFEKAFGKVGSNVDWGFSSKASTRGTRANAGVDYPATSGHINANGNEWAALTTGSNPKTYGGWVVPDPLTEGQIERVKAYFQANPNLNYTDPEWRHFFVQQVYKGGSDVAETSTETITAANNTTYNSNNMTDLYVGPNKDESYKINNFSKGDATVYQNVLDNGEDVNTGSHHSDKIMLMVNIDNTETFTYFNSATSSSFNNKCALVSASDIDEWAAKNGNIGEAVVDKWNRSFLGFDLALMEGSQVYAKDNNGNVVTANYNNAAESPNYAWDGEKVIDISADKTVRKTNGDAIGYLFEHTNWFASEGTIQLNQTQDVQNLTDYSEVNAVVLKSLKYNGTTYQAVVNLPLIKSLADEGYVPTNQYGLTSWHKVGKSDGYFSDWIVTLSKAKRIDEKALYRVIAEDLNASEASDFDFNDVVFDVVKAENNQTTLKLIAAGGIYKLTVAGVEVHEKFGESANEKGEYPMINTGAGPNHDPVEFTINGTYTTPEQIKNIVIKVFKPNTGDDGIELEATTGRPACKILVDDTFGVTKERTDISNEYKNFTKYVTGQFVNEFWWK